MLGRHSQLAALTKGAPIVVLAPHPDDETIGCGALLHSSFSRAGAHVVIMTDGAASHPNSKKWTPEDIAQIRAKETCRAVAKLGGRPPSDLTRLSYPDGELAKQDLSAAVDAVVEVCTRVGARTLFSTHENDDHDDHRASASVARRTREALPHLRLFFYSIWKTKSQPRLPDLASSTERVELTLGDSAPRKQAAIAEYKSQLGQVIDDDPTGFILPAELRAAARADVEVFEAVSL